MVKTRVLGEVLKRKERTRKNEREKIDHVNTKPGRDEQWLKGVSFKFVHRSTCRALRVSCYARENLFCEEIGNAVT